MQIQVIAKSEPGMTGISRYTRDLCVTLQSIGLDALLTFPQAAPMPKSVQQGFKRAGIDVQAFFANYPFRAPLGNPDIYHLSGQMLATLLLLQQFTRPVVVSVLDIIPYMVRHHPTLNTLRHPFDRLFYKLALAGLRRADALVAISEYTRQTLLDVLRLPQERIHVVYPAIDHDKFLPIAVPDAFRAKYALDPASRYILYVGSEDPRKNFPTLLSAFAQLKQQMGNVKLLKVGVAQFVQERMRLQASIAQWGLQHDVRIFDYVPDEDLQLFYNVADVFVLPSLYEGIGLPAVEAMSCGTPVVCASAGSLPEVVGSAAIQVCATDAGEFTRAMLALLASPEMRGQLGEAGRQQAAGFTRTHTARKLEQVYTEVNEVSKHAKARPLNNRIG
jgi:glycosyltransferase involved in cell wall biosynthesis